MDEGKRGNHQGAMPPSLVDRLHTHANAWDDTRVHTTIMVLRQAAGRIEQLERELAELRESYRRLANGEDFYHP